MMSGTVKKTFVAMLAVILAAGLFFVPSTGKRMRASAASGTITVDLEQEAGVSGEGIHEVSDTLYGVFFEDINYGADGGINAEMVVNNSFQFQYLTVGGTITIASSKLQYWEESTSDSNVRSFEAGTDSEMRMSETNDTYLAINVKKNVPTQEYWIANNGYQGGDMQTEGATSEKIEDLDDRPAMAVTEGHRYKFSFYYDNSYYYASDAEDNFRGSVEAYLRHPSGALLSNVVTEEISVSNGWTKVSGVFSAAAAGEDGSPNAWDRGIVTDVNAEGEKVALGSLVFKFKGTGRINLDFISLVDYDSWGADDPRYTGGVFRRDLIEAVEEMNPSFYRFPGGCVAEGTYSWENVYNWENTIGDIEDRKGTPNLWEYYQSYGIGFYEYFLLCEDLGMEPLPVVSAGILCQGRAGWVANGDVAAVKASNVSYFKTEVIDRMAHLIFWAKGDPHSTDATEAEWASKRVAAGHAEPFEMNYLGIGNENWGEDYWLNFDAAVEGLQNYNYKGNPVNLLELFGTITPITDSGVDDGTGALYDNGNANNNYVYHQAWEEIDARSRTAESTAEDPQYEYKYIVDEHYYNSSSWFTTKSNLKRYDADNGYGKVDLTTATTAAGRTFERNGAKIFVGEYSANGDTLKNTLVSAISEAAYMTSLERNSDLVAMASYAPLFSKASASKWPADAIFFNPVNVMKTPNYYVQQMYGNNIGSIYVPDKTFDENFAYTNKVAQSITYNPDTKQIFVKVVNYGTAANDITIDLSAVAGINDGYKRTVLTGNKNDRNSIDAYSGLAVETVAPAYSAGMLTAGKTTVTAPAYSAYVFEFTYGEADASAAATVRVFGKTVDAAANETTVIEVPFGAVRVPQLFVETAASGASYSIDYAEDLTGTTVVTVTPVSGNPVTYSFTYKTAAAPEITLKSAANATITINKAYALTFTVSSGTATVTASGGKYYPETGMFAATSAGTYVLTITSDTDPTVVKTVTITVVNAASAEGIAAPPETGGLPGWGIALIVIGCVVVAGGGGFCLYFFLFRKQVNGFFKKLFGKKTSDTKEAKPETDIAQEDPSASENDPENK